MRWRFDATGKEPRSEVEHAGRDNDRDHKAT